MIRVDELPPPRPGSVFPPGWHETVGSSGAGKAMNLARLGVDVVLHCQLGEDEAGRRVRERLEDAGVTVDAILDRTGTARHVNLMSADGERLSFLTSSRPSSPPPTCLRIRSPISPERTYCQRKNRNAIPKQTTSQPASTAKQTHNGEKGVPSTITWRRASPR